MKKIYLIILICSGFAGYAQQDFQFTQYMFNKIYYNPGVAGSGGAICLNAVHRSQWVGVDGAPTTDNINANVPLNFLHGGVSLKIASDNIGFFQNINAGLGYAYQFQLGDGTLGLGVSFDLFTMAVTAADWKAPENNNDVLIPQTGSTGVSFDLDFGAYYETEKWWAGISSARMLQSATPLTGSINSISQFYNRRHYYVMGGYNYQLPSTNWELRPSLLLKSDFAASSVVDVNVTGVYNNKFWAGVSYRLTEAAAVNIGYQFTESLKAGYSYDIPLSDISQQGSGSHEIFLSYCFKVEIPPKVPGSYKNVRFL